MNHILLIEIVYVLITLLVVYRIIMDSQTSDKALGYILITILLPIVGSLLYFSFGINYRKNKIYSKKIIQNKETFDRITREMQHYSLGLIQDNPEMMDKYKFISQMLMKEDNSLLTAGNKFKLLINGEEKFEALMKDIQQAKHHIHIEYYIFEPGIIADKLTGLLIQKAKEGVEVRVIYDDFASSKIKKRIIPQLMEHGIQCEAFYKIKLLLFANRMNYRNHRKIIIIDGKISYTGGINISDRYANNLGLQQRFWRDTHLRVDGFGSINLQHIFLCDWNFCSKNKITDFRNYLPHNQSQRNSKNKKNEGAIFQTASSGPDSDYPSILYAMVQSIATARKEIFITTPYFIPDKTLLNAIKIAALSGIAVKILVPLVGDSSVVNKSAKSHFEEILISGAEIYRYKKGFVHAKTMSIDDDLSIIGTANLDARSFELNFEIDAMVYDKSITQKLKGQFLKDLEYSEKLILADWQKRPFIQKFLEKFFNLFSPLM